MGQESLHHLEIEIKLKLTDLPLARRFLPDAGFVLLDPRQFERNILFDTPDHSLASRNQLLRLRRFGNKNIITFKRPVKENDTDDEYKIREEIESGIGHFERMKTILLGLEYRMVWIYEKYRETWRRGPVTVFLDETPIGNFMEIEAPENEIDVMAQAFGYTKKDYITRNYRRLFVEMGYSGDMVFER